MIVWGTKIWEKKAGVEGVGDAQKGGRGGDKAIKGMKEMIVQWTTPPNSELPIKRRDSETRNLNKVDLVKGMSDHK